MMERQHTAEERLYMADADMRADASTIANRLEQIVAANRLPNEPNKLIKDLIWALRNRPSRGGDVTAASLCDAADRWAAADHRRQYDAIPHVDIQHLLNMAAYAAVAAGKRNHVIWALREPFYIRQAHEAARELMLARQKIERLPIKMSADKAPCLAQD